MKKFVVVWLLICIKGIISECPSQETILPCRCQERINDYQIWCSHSDLTRVLSAFPSINKQIDRSIDELILENNNLPALPGKTFANLKVVRLMLRYNRLERVSNSWLTGLEDSLMELYLVEPELKSLPDDCLSRLVTLEAVTIQSNMLKRLPSFSYLPNLNYLLLESSMLMELSPRNFKQVNSLEKILISGSLLLNKLEEDVFQDIPALKVLNISYCGLSFIHPRSITRLPSLTQLSLIGNKLNDAPMIGRAIRDLPNLQTLHLDWNNIEKLTEGTFIDLPSLNLLSISNNRIKEINRGVFHRLPMLKTINLNYNNIKNIHPESVLASNRIRDLWLSYNEITLNGLEIREIFEAFPNLAFLDLSYNQIKSIPGGAIRGHLNLERLNLNYNLINEIHQLAFVDLPVLRELSLKNNSLSDSFYENVYPYWDLPNLKGLDLSGNYFNVIDGWFLRNLPSLRRIDLSLNGIKFINPRAFSNSPLLEYVNVSHNKLEDLRDLINDLAGLYELDVGYNKLKRFIPFLPNGLEYLHLKNNDISNLPDKKSQILELPYLKLLDLSGNKIKYIEENGLRKLIGLKKLFLGNNLIRNVNNAAFGGLINLEILDLQRNQLNQIPQYLFYELVQLKALNLKRNKLIEVEKNVFNNNGYLKMIDLSENQIKQLPIFENNKIETINASFNQLTTLPQSLSKLESLKNLDLTNNKIKELINLSSLKSLVELKVSNNKIQNIKSSTFEDLENIKIIYLNNNEIVQIETNSFNSLPALKHVKLNDNKLSYLPNFAFNNLGNLQIIELQKNLIEKIAKNAFHQIPHILMLNLSNNLIFEMNQAGLGTLKSLEMLDLSYNRLVEVETENLDNMEWLVELKIDNNAICGVKGISFNKMPRLRVLSLRNNKMMSFPERAVNKLRGNLAILDIDGNPLACTCSLLWLRAWLKESLTKGPRCIDGNLLIDSRLSRDDCLQESRLLDPVAEGCESELLSLPNPYDGTNLYTPWMKSNNSEKINTKNQINPEDSDYFYDEYIDYHLNETLNDVKNLPIEHKSSTEKINLGNTPTIYAAINKNQNHTKNIPKEIVGSPSSSGFTFFGLPLPTINLNNIFNNRNLNKKTLETKPLKVIETPPQAERKISILNKPSREDSSRKMFPILSKPEIQSGFIPLLPESGGFKPIPNPNLRGSEIQIEKAEINVTKFDQSQTESYLFTKNFHPIPTPSNQIIPATTEIPNKIKTNIFVEPKNESTTNKSKLKPVEIEQIKNISEFLSTTTSLPVKLENTTYPDLETSGDNKSFEDIFKDVVDNVSFPSIINLSTINFNQVATSTTPIPNFVSKLHDEKVEKKLIVQKPALLIPGGFQPPYKPSGKSKITKVTSPFSTKPPPKLREKETAENDYDLITTDIMEIDKSWYFASYNEKKQASNYNYYGQNCSGRKEIVSRYMFLIVFVKLFL
ncbi:protein artichoke [Onthophagus taurus]|uniref:protein artichoke n=1 Tax=Onthophagus taurus TaxID=166361 RepID=UPI0039BDEC2F